jgi:hypothetical protein
MRRLTSRRRIPTRSTRVIAACLLVVLVVAGVLGGVHGVDVVAAPSACVLLPDLADAWPRPCATDTALQSADVAPLLPPRAPPILSSL